MVSVTGFILGFIVYIVVGFAVNVLLEPNMETYHEVARWRVFGYKQMEGTQLYKEGWGELVVGILWFIPVIIILARKAGR